MTVAPPTEPFMPIGARYQVVYAMNQLTGLINPTALPVSGVVPAYDGIELVGARALNLTIPNPNVIPQFGNDRIMALDSLPPKQPITGEVHSSAVNFILDALASNVKTSTVGGISILPRYTDQQGNEPMLGFMAYQQGLTKSGKRVWHAYQIPSTRFIPMASQQTENAEDMRYFLTPNPASLYLWGQPLSLSNDNATQTGIVSTVSYYRPHVSAWLADGTVEQFGFNASFPAVDSAHVNVFENGVLVTTGFTVDPVTGLTFSSAPTAGLITAFYELRN